ncbi:hypothetical protein CEXT_794751 [Caerostris extrusa]|uniref:Uncharacterized protein n=1 Tax=Caerostris extrusa TaxID=172846 RepID=A0AAV4N6R0_CAEEX|nr:hypothetical protein CEXT_794751 [Caerostris extrusa]
MGVYITVDWKLGLYFNSELSIVFFNSVSYVTSILWIAGGLPVEVNKFKEAFHRKTHARLLYGDATEVMNLKNDLFHERIRDDRMRYPAYQKKHYFWFGWNNSHIYRAHDDNRGSMNNSFDKFLNIFPAFY